MSRTQQPPLLRHLFATAPRRLARGFSLIEVLVASAVFLLIMLAVYQVYIRALESQKAGVGQAEMTQSVRFGFEEMATRIRSAGYEFDLDGPPRNADNQSDESIEYMGPSAIMVRANYDFAFEDFRGREEVYESGSEGDCCPVVTTGNDEILAFALSKDEGDPDQPSETMTVYLDLDAPRDGKINRDTGDISGEETITIPNVALTNFTDPPYVLYQFAWEDPVDGGPPVLQRRPLVDNIISLEFEYFDEGGNNIAFDGGGNPLALPGGGPSPASDAAADSIGRSRRENVRKVRIRIKGMTPDPDLRYTDPTDSNPATNKHRKFELVEDVHTFNVGRRGLKDRDDRPPEGVTDVQLCSGQCGLVRVDWKPGPPEDRVSDHVIILASCPGGSSPNYNSPLATFVLVSDLDLSVTPEREFVVFDLEDDADLVAGTAVCARVIPRDDSGSESEDPADSDKNSVSLNPTPNDYTVIEDYSRAEAPSEGYGSGYERTDTDWPDAKEDNDSAGVEITDSNMLDSYPVSNAIALSWTKPIYQLNRLSQGGGTLYDWTTAPGAGYAASFYDTDESVSCYRSESTPNDASADFRTPTEELSDFPADDKPNVYIFRVSGSDRSNWGPAQSECYDMPIGPNCIEEARNFMPHAGNLYALVSRSMAGATFSYTDSTESTFYTPLGSTDPYEARFLSTRTNDVKPDGYASPLGSVTPGEVYYYRVRVVDYCWTDADRDGVEDSTAGGAQPLAAWSTQEDFPSEAAWREASVPMSPFYPPFKHQGAGGTPSDLPSTSDQDSDLVDLADLGSDIDAYALPGYAIPTFVQGTSYVRPEKPSEFYLSNANDSASTLIPDVGGEKGVRVLFNSAKRNAPHDTAGAGALQPESVNYTWYHLRRFAVPAYIPGTALTSAQVDWDYTAGDAVTSFRLSDAGLYDYTIDRRAEVLDEMNSALKNDALYLSALPHVYKLFTMQVSNQTLYDPVAGGGLGMNDLPLHVADDGITNDAARYSVGSRAFLYPTPFYDGVSDIDVAPVPDSGLLTTRVDVTVELDPLTDPAGDCANVKAARLLAYNEATGQFLGASDWIATPAAGVPADCSFDFNSILVGQSLRGSTDRAHYEVELSDVNETLTDGGAWDKQPRGARVRSGLLGVAGDYSLATTCAGGCGDNTANDPANTGNRILGHVTKDEIQTFAGGTIMSIELAVDACNTQDFSLLQIDVSIDTAGAAMPNFVAATLSGLRTGPTALPAPEFAGIDGALYRLRWFEGSFCDDSGVCAFPVVDKDSGTINLRLAFDGPVCDGPILDSFNFRVYVDNGGALEELLCSNRAEFDPDDNGGGAADEADHYCVLNGTDTLVNCGRGPSVETEDCSQNLDCVPDCYLALCPVNSDFLDPPSISLSPDDLIVTIAQTEDCSGGCALSLTEVRATFACDEVDRLCAVDDIPTFANAYLVWADDTEFELTGAAVTVNPGNDVAIEWAGLTGFDVLPGEQFRIRFTFLGGMTDTVLTNWELQFGAPLDPVADCDAASSFDIPSN